MDPHAVRQTWWRRLLIEERQYTIIYIFVIEFKIPGQKYLFKFKYTILFQLLSVKKKMEEKTG